MAAHITFRRVNATEMDIGLGTYAVLADGVEVGTVWRAWFRLGGLCWTNSVVTAQGFSTRLEAARHLVRRQPVVSTEGGR